MCGLTHNLFLPLEINLRWEMNQKKKKKLGNQVQCLPTKMYIPSYLHFVCSYWLIYKKKWIHIKVHNIIFQNCFANRILKGDSAGPHAVLKYCWYFIHFLI